MLDRLPQSEKERKKKKSTTNPKERRAGFNQCFNEQESSTEIKKLKASKKNWAIRGALHPIDWRSKLAGNDSL